MWHDKCIDVKFVVSACAASVVATLYAEGGAVPFSAIRLRKPQTDSDKVWRATCEQFRKYRAGVDEVWFSTGISFPKMSEHRANAARLARASADLRALGIEPSLQIQATIGHGDMLTLYADNSGITWQTYVAANDTVTFGGLPLVDYPLVLADRRCVKLVAPVSFSSIGCPDDWRKYALWK